MIDGSSPGILALVFLRVLLLQLRNVSQQFVLIRHPAKVETNHLVRSQSRLAARPQRDQHARDDRRVRLDFDAVLIVAAQMTAAQHVLEEPKENLDRPTFLVQKCNCLSWHVELVRCDAKNSVAVDATRTATTLPTRSVIRGNAATREPSSLRLSAVSRSQPSSCSRWSNGPGCLKNFSPVISSSLILGRAAAGITMPHAVNAPSCNAN